MTEEEWLTWTDQRDCIHRLLNQLHSPFARSFTERKLRLFAASCCHQVLSLCKDPRTLLALDAVERSIRAKTNAERQGLKQARAVIWSDNHWRDTAENRLAKALVTKSDYSLALGASYLASFLKVGEIERARVERFGQGPVFRDIVGNPFRPVAFDPRWRSESAVALASAIYAERAFDRMPILADALEEAGCDHPDVLHHCRDPQQVHARGCWVVDLVLGKQ